MKQFQRKGPTGQLYGPFGLDTARSMCFPLRYWLAAAAVGDTAVDAGNDVWERLPDLMDPGASTEALTRAGVIVGEALEASNQQAERLERIATAALPWALSTRNPGSGWDEVAASLAVAAAKALIAELDKQS